MFSSAIRQNSRNSLSIPLTVWQSPDIPASLDIMKSYFPQASHGGIFRFFKQPEPTLASFPYNYGQRLDIEYHDTGELDPSGFYHTDQAMNPNHPLFFPPPPPLQTSQPFDQRTQAPPSTNYAVYLNDFHSALSEIDTASTATFSPSTLLSPTTASSATLVEEEQSSRPSRPPTPFIKHRPGVGIPQVIRMDESQASSSSSDSSLEEPFFCSPQTTCGTESEVLNRRNLDYYTGASRRNSYIQPLPPQTPQRSPLIPSIPLSTSPEPLKGLRKHVHPISPIDTTGFPWPKKSDPIDQFIPPLAAREEVPSRPESRAQKRRSYASVVSGKPSQPIADVQTNQNRPLPVPPPPAMGNLSRQGNFSANGMKRTLSTNPAFNMFSQQPQVVSQQTTAIDKQRAKRNSTMNPGAPTQMVRPPSAGPHPLLQVRDDTVKPAARPTKKSPPAEPIVRMPSRGPTPVVQVQPTPLMRHSSRNGLPLPAQPQVGAPRASAMRHRRNSDAVTPLPTGIPSGQEPQRRRTDGERHHRPRGGQQRTVRWCENLICPSPVFIERRTGWFNRRGDQLWTNSGAYRPPIPGQEYPIDLDEYPEYGEGWMNEAGVRIDMTHCLVPKVPLRSAMKQARAA